MPEDESPLGRLTQHWPRLVVAALIVFGAALRIWILRSPMGQLDSDEAIAGLMARHLMRGHVSFYFWGQAYGGSAEPSLAGPAVLVFGSSRIALKAVSIILSAGASILVWRIGLRTVGRQAALIGAGFFWAGPLAFVWLSTKERGFYQSTMIAGLTVMLCSLRLGERGSWRDATVLGLAAGIGIWSSPQVMYLLLPSLIWLALRCPRHWRLLAAAVPAGVVGLLPAILYNVRNRFTSLDVPSFAYPSTYTDRFKLFFTRGLSYAIGARVPYTQTWVNRAVGPVLTIGVVAVLVVAGVQLGRSWHRFNRSEVLLITVVVYPFIFALSPYSIYIREPRYLYFLSAPLCLLAARVAGRASPAVAVTLAVVAVASMHSLLVWPDRVINQELVTEDPTPLIAELDREGITQAWGDYWLSYETIFATDERILVVPMKVDRHEEWKSIILRNPNPPWLLLRDSPEDKAFQRATAARQITFTANIVGRTIIYKPSSRVVPTDILSELR